MVAVPLSWTARPAADRRRSARVDRHDGTRQPELGRRAHSGELLKLRIVASRRSIQRYRRGPARPAGQSWRTFLANHRPRVWAADLLTVQTLTFKTLYILLFVSHDRRELVHANVTASPTAGWVWRQLIAATPWAARPASWCATATRSTAATSCRGPAGSASRRSSHRSGRAG